MITDKGGKTLKTVALNGSYSVNIKVETSMLASGAYQYALIIDGSLVDKKQMLRMKNNYNRSASLICIVPAGFSLHTFQS